MDRAGHVIDLAAAAADYVSSEAAEALQVLQRYGTLLMNLAEAAVSGIDLSKEESWEEAKAAVDAAVDKAFDEGIFYMSNAEYDFAHAEENRERYDLMLVVGDEVQYIKAPFSKNSKISKHLKIVEDSWKGFAV